MFNVVLELMTEVAQEALNWPCRRFAKRANRVTLDLAGCRQQQVQVFRPALSVLDAPQQSVHPTGSLATGRALAAGLCIIKARDARAGRSHVRSLIHDNNRAG